MSYTIQEGTVTIPSPYKDRTVNLFLVDDQENGTFNLVINRDVMEPGETLEGCVSRQMKMMTRQMPSFKELSRRRIEVGTTRLPAFEVAVQALQNKQTMHQLQAVIELGGVKVLMITMTSPSPFTDGLQKKWTDIVASFTPVQV